MPKIINSTPFAIKVDGETVIAGKELDVTMILGHQTFISSSHGYANISFNGTIPACDNAFGDIEVSVPSAKMIIVRTKHK